MHMKKLKKNICKDLYLKKKIKAKGEWEEEEAKIEGLNNHNYR